MTQPLNIKWLIGDSNKKPLVEQSYLMLEVSIRYARLLFPEAKRHISVPHIKDGMWRIEEIADKFDCAIIRTRHHPEIQELPPFLRKTKHRSAWWKYIPLKIGDGHTLHLDNDFIVWRIPPQLEAWLESGGLLGYGIEKDNPDQPYTKHIDWSKGIHFGSKSGLVKRLAGTMGLNSGLFGIGADVEKLPYAFDNIKKVKLFVEDQAWWTINFAQYEGELGVNKHIIHYEDDMPVMSKFSPYAKEQTPFSEVLPHFYGAHFTTHNTGYCRYYHNHCHEHFIADLERLEG